MHTTASVRNIFDESAHLSYNGKQQKFNIEAVNDYPLIRFERKFPIRRSLPYIAF